MGFRGNDPMEAAARMSRDSHACSGWTPPGVEQNYAQHPCFNISNTSRRKELSGVNPGCERGTVQRDKIDSKENPPGE